jgi:hypothetical protein
VCWLIPLSTQQHKLDDGRHSPQLSRQNAMNLDLFQVFRLRDRVKCMSNQHVYQRIPIPSQLFSPVIAQVRFRIYSGYTPAGDNAVSVRAAAQRPRGPGKEVLCGGL